jgi:NADH dehydrogenase FAD-containing subunit
MSITKRKHFVIVGGGASGVLLTCHLLRGGADDVQVTLISMSAQPI